MQGSYRDIKYTVVVVEDGCESSRYMLSCGSSYTLNITFDLQLNSTINQKS
jgi:hypothetical protein